MLDVLTSLARLGRSLGIHLLLCSQRLDDGRLRGLDAHLRYRICLRTCTQCRVDRRDRHPRGGPAALGAGLGPGSPRWRAHPAAGGPRRLAQSMRSTRGEIATCRRSRVTPCHRRARSACPRCRRRSWTSPGYPQPVPARSASTASGLLDRPDLGLQLPLTLDLAGRWPPGGRGRAAKRSIDAAGDDCCRRARRRRSRTELAIHVISAPSLLTAIARPPPRRDGGHLRAARPRVIRAVADLVADVASRDGAEARRVLLVVDDVGRRARLEDDASPTSGRRSPPPGNRSACRWRSAAAGGRSFAVVCARPSAAGSSCG